MRFLPYLIILALGACSSTGPAQQGPNDATGTSGSPLSAGAVNPQTGANNGATAR